MGKAGLALRLQPETNAVRDAQAKRRRRVIFRNDYGESVGQRLLLQGDREIGCGAGRAHAQRSEECCGDKKQQSPTGKEHQKTSQIVLTMIG